LLAIWRYDRIYRFFAHLTKLNKKKVDKHKPVVYIKDMKANNHTNREVRMGAKFSVGDTVRQTRRSICGIELAEAEMDTVTIEYIGAKYYAVIEQPFGVQSVRHISDVDADYRLVGS
jgi:hypothetical protein